MNAAPHVLTGDVLSLIAGLSNGREGKSWATQRSKRRMLTEKLGRGIGEQSIRRVELRLEASGRLRRRRVLPGGRLPNGGYTAHGTTVVELVSRQIARAEARQRMKRARRASAAATGASGTGAGRTVAAASKRSMASAHAPALRPMSQAERAELAAKMRADSAALELLATFRSIEERARGKPPD
jgi:hypothetical protein